MKNKIMFALLLLCHLLLLAKPTPIDIDRRLKLLTDASFKQSISPKKTFDIKLQCYKDSKGIGYKEGIKKSGLALAISYSNNLDYENSLKISNEIKDLMQNSDNDRPLVEYYKCRGLCYTYVGLLKEGMKEYQKAISVAEKIKDADTRNYMISVVSCDLAYNYCFVPNTDSISHYMSEALIAGEKISKNGILAKTGELNQWLIDLNYFLGGYYLDNNPDNLAIARKHYTTAKNIYEKSNTKMVLGGEINFLSYLCKFYYMDKQYEEAIKYGLKCLELQKKEKRPDARKIALEYMAKSYLEIGKVKDYNNYMDQYLALVDSFNIQERNTAVKTIQHVVSQKEQDSNSNKEQILYTSTVILSVVSLTCLYFWKQKNKKLRAKYLSLIENIKNEDHKIFIAENDKAKKVYSVQEDTYNKIIEKLEKFEINLGFLKKDLTISYMSNQFKTNPKSLSSIIKSKTGKNFNTYINDLRINYILKKLYDDRLYREYKIEYLAEECGYSSSKVFVNAFKKTTDVTPSYYISNLKKDLG